MGYLRHALIGSVTAIGSVAVSCMVSHETLAPLAMVAACKAGIVAAFVSYWIGAIQNPPEKQ